jgi:hypothetical protein
MKKFASAIALMCLAVLSYAQTPALSGDDAGKPLANFATSYSIIAVNWDKFVGECQIQAVSEKTLYYIYAKQALWGTNCSHLPDLHSTVWGSGVKHHRGNGDQIRLVYSTEGGKASTVSYFLSRTTPYRDK